MRSREKELEIWNRILRDKERCKFHDHWVGYTKPKDDQLCIREYRGVEMGPGICDGPCRHWKGN